MINEFYDFLFFIQLLMRPKNTVDHSICFVRCSSPYHDDSHLLKDIHKKLNVSA